MSDDYRQPPDSGRSRPITLVCQQGVPPEILSGWRDGLLPPDQAAWLERHAPTCPACGERLRDYDNAASALSGQVIPRPGADLWPSVRAAIERETRGAGNAARRGPRLPRGMALGGVGAGLVALLLVALFAGLLFSRQSGRPTATATPIATLAVTATIAATATPSGPGYWTTLSGCSGVPAGIRTVYNAGVQEQKGGAPTIVTLQRSDDCGATWTNLTPPQITGVSYTTNVNLMTIFTSPLNPNTAYLTLQVSGTACSSTSAAARSAQSSTVCQPQFVTTNGGASWQRLALPVRGILGVISASSVTSLSVEGMLRPQGSLLYGVVTDATLASSGVIPPGRLVVSSDGGVHWTLCDGPLATQGYGVWDFAVTPTGTTIFVTAEPFNDPSRQPPSYSPPLSIWSSPDGGHTWTEGGPAPGSGVSQSGVVLFMSAGMNGGHAIAYIVAEDNGLARMLASVDGGRVWQEDTALKYADTGGEIFELLGMLPDGSVVIEQPAGGGPTLAWKPGSAQRIIAQNADLLSYFHPIFQRRGDGLYLWLMGTPSNSGSTALTTEYTQLKL